MLFDVTGNGTPQPVFAGHPADFDGVDLGTFAPGEERDYLFSRYAGRDGPATTTDYQGAGLSLGFEWQAGDGRRVDARRRRRPLRRRAKPQAEAEAQAQAEAQATARPRRCRSTWRPCSACPPSTKCFKGGKLKFKLKAPAGTKVVSATVAVNGKTKARLKGKKVAQGRSTLKRLRKTATVTVAAKVTGGRTYIGTRAYVSCKR